MADENKTDEQKAESIANLLAERRGYVQRGLDDRVKDVDEQLRRYGHEAAPAAARATKRPATRAKKVESR